MLNTLYLFIFIRYGSRITFTTNQLYFKQFFEDVHNLSFDTESIGNKNFQEEIGEYLLKEIIQ